MIPLRNPYAPPLIPTIRFAGYNGSGPETYFVDKIGIDFILQLKVLLIDLLKPKNIVRLLLWHNRVHMNLSA